MLGDELVRAADPYPLYRRLRDDEPVAYLPQLQWYAVTRHADVEAVLRSPSRLSSSIMRGADRALLGRDPPAHTVVRKVAARAFDAARIRALGDRIADTARTLIRAFARAGGGDFVREVAVELPLRIIAQLLGLDAELTPALKQWSEAVLLGAGRAIPPGREAEVARRLGDFDRFFADLVARRRAQPGDDAVSALVEAELSEPDLCSLAKLLLVAGNETTTNLMSNAVLALLAEPALEPELRAHPELVPAWVEETLRFDAPVQVLLRRAQVELELHGVRIAPGTIVAAVVGSANRDERHHPRADRFDLSRRASHLAFGAGPHVCLGAALARLEATIGLGVLLEETRRLEVCERLADIPRARSLQLRGPQRLRLAVAS